MNIRFLLLETGLTKNKRNLTDTYTVQKTSVRGSRQRNDVSRNPLTSNSVNATVGSTAIYSSNSSGKRSGSLANGGASGHSVSGTDVPGSGNCVPENGIGAEVNENSVLVNGPGATETKITVSENEIGVSWSGIGSTWIESNIFSNSTGIAMSKNTSVSGAGVSSRGFCFPRESSNRNDNLIATAAEMTSLNGNDQTSASLPVPESSASHPQMTVVKNYDPSNAGKPSIPSSNYQETESQFLRVDRINLSPSIGHPSSETICYNSNTTDRHPRDTIVDRICQAVVTDEPVQLQTLEIPAALASTFEKRLPTSRPAHPCDTQWTISHNSISDVSIPRTGDRSPSAGRRNLSRKVFGEYRSMLFNGSQEVECGTTTTVRNGTNKATTKRLLSVRTDQEENMKGSPPDRDLHRTSFLTLGKRNTRQKCCPTHQLDITGSVSSPHRRKNPTPTLNSAESCPRPPGDAIFRLPPVHKPTYHSLELDPSLRISIPRLMSNEEFLAQRPSSSKNIPSQPPLLRPSFPPLAPTSNLPQNRPIPSTTPQKHQRSERLCLDPAGQPQTESSRSSYRPQDTTYKPKCLSKRYNPIQIGLNKPTGEWPSFGQPNWKTQGRDGLENFNYLRCLPPGDSFQRQFLHSRKDNHCCFHASSSSDPSFYERDRWQSPGSGSDVISDTRILCNDPAIQQLQNLRERVMLLRRANSLLGAKLWDSRATLESRLQRMEKRGVEYGCHDNTTAASLADEAAYLIHL